MASPDERSRKRRQQTIFQSARAANTAIRRALRELSPTQREAAQIKPRAVIRTQEGLQRQYPSLARSVAAVATNPVSFAVGQDFRLVSSQPLGAARHEVGHLLGFTTPKKTFAGHVALRAAGAEQSAVGLRSVPGVSQEPFGRQMTMAQQRASRQRQPHLVSGVTSTARSKSTPGFQTPQLTKVAETGTTEQRARARTQMRRLGRRLKSRGIDF